MKKSAFVLSLFCLLTAVNRPEAQTTISTQPAAQVAAAAQKGAMPAHASSSVHFEQALTAFQARKYEEASREIMNGAEALRLEAPYTEAPGERKLLYQRLNDLVNLSETVAAGNLHNDDALLAAFSNAQLSVVHRDFLILHDLVGKGGEYLTVDQIESMRDHLLTAKRHQTTEKATQLNALAQQADNLCFQINQLKVKPLSPALNEDLANLLTAVKALNVQ